MKLYCIEVERELEDKKVIHHWVNDEDAPMTRKDVLYFINTYYADLHYDDDYGRLTFYEVEQ